MDNIRIDKQIIRLIGDLGENLVRQALKREHYNLEDFDRCDAKICFRCGYSLEGRPPPNYNESQTSLEQYMDSFSIFKYPDNCKRGEKWIKLMRYRDELESRYSSYRGSSLDFYATKDDKEYLIEVKTNKGNLEKSQAKLIEYSKELGYIPLLINVRVASKITKIKEL